MTDTKTIRSSVIKQSYVSKNASLRTNSCVEK